MATNKLVRLAAVETGGQSIRVAIAEMPTNEKKQQESLVPWTIITRHTIKTTPDSASCIAAVRSWLQQQGPVDGLGVAAFGPIDASPESPTYGHITTSPKPGWRNVPLLRGILSAYNGKVPVNFDTDVNAAALNELSHSNIFPQCGSGDSCAYITVGTGVGVGVVVGKKAVHGLLHPEMGHMSAPRAKGDTYPGNCPWHKFVPCVEAMVGSRALAERFNVPMSKLSTVPDDDPQWDYIAFYLAHVCAALVLTVSPCMIVFGGGVINRACLLPKIRAYTLQMLSGYISSPCLTADMIDKYIVRSPFGGDAGINGAIELARLAWKNNQHPQALPARY